MSIGKVNVVTAFANCDMATIAWCTNEPIPGCRGFAIQRQVGGKAGDAADGFVNTWVGFKGDAHKSGESRPSTVWPVQRYLWSDYVVSLGQKIRYRVIPMVGPAGHLKQAPDDQCSSWTPWVAIDTEKTKGFHAYFNRGIVPSQFMAQQDNDLTSFKKMLAQNINNPKSKIRTFLAGTLRDYLLDLLKDAATNGVNIYAALYELNDPELIAALKKIGDKCNLVLGSGAYKAANKKKGTPAVPDENKQWRADLKKNSKVVVFDRLVKSPHFAHNKFVVFCDKSGKPSTVWTGSTNWTVTGLCTQTNNGILIDDPKIAAAYLRRWEALRDAKAGYPKNVAQAGSTAAKSGSNSTPRLTAWNVPCQKFVDLKDAKQHILSAKEGILFLMFNPGVGDGKKKEFALIQDIMALDTNKLFIHGILNQDPGGKNNPLIQFVHKGQSLPRVELTAILPKALKSAGRKFFKSEFQYNMVMIHSKVIVVDPFGDNPVVMTGSHNLGPKASASNDDNLVIVEQAPGLATEYAVYIMNVYGHYKWLYNEYLRTQDDQTKGKKASPQYDGNQDNDVWQHNYLEGPNRREIDFWLNDADMAAKPARRKSSRVGRRSAKH